MNEVNAMISFGNTFIYKRIANEIYRTALDIRIGFVHAANSRSESLKLYCEIFKPIISRNHFNHHNGTETENQHFKGNMVQISLNNDEM